MAELEWRGNVVRNLAILFAVVSVAFVIYCLSDSGIDGPHEQAPRAKCSSNMHQIGLAITMYAQDDPLGRFPDDLYTLMMTEGLASEVFVCPSTHDTPAVQSGLKYLTAGGHLSYIYIGAGLTNKSPADAVVLYEPLSNHDNTGSNVLFADGHVEFIPVPQAAQLADMAQAGIRPIYWPPHPATQPSTRP